MAEAKELLERYNHVKPTDSAKRIKFDESDDDEDESEHEPPNSDDEAPEDSSEIDSKGCTTDVIKAVKVPTKGTQSKGGEDEVATAHRIIQMKVERTFEIAKALA